MEVPILHAAGLCVVVLVVIGGAADGEAGARREGGGGHGIQGEGPSLLLYID